MTPPLRVVIVDDERLARQRIRTLLRDHDDVEIIAECENGRVAIETLRQCDADLVFLDVQMPEVDGFDVARALDGKLPSIIFVTAHDQHALRAFDVSAIDYLLKPFERARFEQALERARSARTAHAPDFGRLLTLVQELTPRRSARIVVKTAGRLTFIDPGEVDWIEAAGNYLRIHVGRETHLIRETMKSIKARLDPRQFRRVHRSVIVNLDRVKQLEPYTRGEYVVMLRDGTRITTSGGYGRQLRAALEGEPPSGT